MIKKTSVPMLCIYILNVGTLHTLCILNVVTFPTLCISNVGTVPTFSSSHISKSMSWLKEEVKHNDINPHISTISWLATPALSYEHQQNVNIEVETYICDLHGFCKQNEFISASFSTRNIYSSSWVHLEQSRDSAGGQAIIL